MTVFALVKELAGVIGHALGLCMAAHWAGQHRVENSRCHGFNVALEVIRFSMVHSEHDSIGQHVFANQLARAVQPAFDRSRLLPQALRDFTNG